MAPGEMTREELIRTELGKLYSGNVVDHAMHPRNMKEMADADGYAKITGPCGDTMEIWLSVRNDTISEASFLTDGCVTSVAAGSMAVEMAGGRSVTGAMKISQQDVLTALDGLPEDSEHCALLAANTLKAALRDYLSIKREPWKKGYRKYQ